MTKRDVLKLERCTVGDTPIKYIEISVFMVARGNFNDERLIETRWLCLEKIKDKPFEWVDLYLGKKTASTKKIAIAYVQGAEVYFLESDADGVRAVKKNEYTHYYSDDHDDGFIISAHIEATTSKW